MRQNKAQENGNAPKRAPVTVLDAFAGAGGFSLGLQLAGCSVIGGIEHDGWAAETFAFNHPHARVLVRNIEEIGDLEIVEAFGNPSPTIVVGGPPCQGFSLCRRDAGDPTDPRNSLFQEFIRLGRLLSPEVMVMENVPNLLKAATQSGEPVIEIILAELKELGYHVYYDVLQAVDYGVPQIRKRLFVIASRASLTTPFPKPTHAFNDQQFLFSSLLKTPTLWEAISDLPPIEAGQGAYELEYTGPATNDYQSELRAHSSRVFNHTAMKHSRRMIERFSAMRSGESVTDVPHHLKPLARNGNGKISHSAYDQNNRRMHPDRPCHTIPAAFYANFVHPFLRQKLHPERGGAPPIVS